MKTTRLVDEMPPDRSERAEVVPSLSGGGTRLAGLAISMAALSAVFWRPLVSLIQYASANSLHSHVLLVPFISGYLIYLQRQARPSSYRSSPCIGALALATGIATSVYASRLQSTLSPGDYLSLIAFSWVTLLIAAGFFFLGRKWMWTFCLPVAFLYFLVPLPDTAVHGLETVLKLGSAEAAATFFDLFGTPVLRDALVFQLPNITLEVAQECSGIRSSWVLFMTSVVASYVLLKSSWRRTALLAAVVPLAILRNGFRILVIGWLCVRYGPQMIHSFIHESGGPIFFALSLIPLFMLLWWLRKGEVKTPLEKEHL